MTSDEPMPLTLPDTQNADALCLTQSQELPNSQEARIVWGRLLPVKSPFKMIEMTKDEYTFGRSEKCDVCVTKMNIKDKQRDVISKIHFRITRTYISNDNEDFIVHLDDLSHNGTYVNKSLIGRGKRIILQTNDVIAIAVPTFVVYTFMSTMTFEGSDLPLELRRKYAVSRTLGNGACGEVKMVFTKIGCKQFAMKTIVKKILTNGCKHSLNDPEKIMNEVKILKALKHPCIIRMEEIVDTPSTVYIVLELMEGGELFDRISKGKGLSEKIAKLIFYQVVLAVHYLHEHGITHRDLKPENILLASNSDVTLAKVTDFGLSKLVNAETMMQTFCGTPMYVAPEILLTYGRGSYTSQVDVWSLGVILYCCLSGRVPFCTNNTNLSLHGQIVQGNYRFPASHFQNVSARAINLIKRMLTVNPKNRITINEIVLHPWLHDRDMRNTVNTLMGRDEVNNENAVPSSSTNYSDPKPNKLSALLKRPRIE